MDTAAKDMLIWPARVVMVARSMGDAPPAIVVSPQGRRLGETCRLLAQASWATDTPSQQKSEHRVLDGFFVWPSVHLPHRR